MENLSFENYLKTLLKADNRLVDEENDIQINVLRDLVNNLDSQLIELLIADDKIREKFFIKIKDVYVFKQNDFIFYLDSKVLDGSYTQYANRIGLASGGKFLTDSTDYVLDFPYKDCVLEGGQSTEEGNDVYFEYDADTNDYVEKTAKRKEIFYNNIIAKDEIDRLLEPKAFQKVVRYDTNGKTIPTSFTRDAELNSQRGLPEDTITDNLIIKGNNLLALHSLEKEFKGKVKLIYIDPPYNTGSDSFAYNDKFNHSAWLTFMYNRLKVAKELLSEDGNIIVQLDFNEVHYCKILMDLIFGRDNFRNEIIWHYEKWTAGSKSLQKNHDNLLLYSKSENYLFNEIKEVTDNLREKYKKGYLIGGGYGSEGLVVYDKNNPEAIEKINSGKYKVVYADMDGKPLSNVWKLPFINPVAKERTGFNSQKPEVLLKRIIEITTNLNDIILDYHIGSGTTPAICHKMNRQYIGVEQMDYINSLTIPRLEKVIKGDISGISKDVNWQGGGSFVYAELAKNNETAKERIAACINLEELIQLFEELNTRYFLDYNVRIKDFKENVVKEEAFINLSLARQKEIFKRMLDNNQLYVNLSEVEDARYNLSEDAIRLTKDFYQIKS